MFAPIQQVGFIRITLAGALVLLAATWLTARAQTPQTTQPWPNRPASAQPTPDDKKNEGVDFATRDFDARTRLILKKEKKEHEEHVERARDAADLAAELEKTYETNRVFNAADYKKLERLEKLTRRVRNDVGGSQTDGDPKDLPRSIEEAVPMLATMAKELFEEVENTPRRVVSASIIDRANKLISVIQFVRGPRD